jgi:RNA polymerase sigma-70 factor, ECF subfamily
MKPTPRRPPDDRREDQLLPLEAMIKTHANTLWRSALVMSRNEHTARDLAQETWLEVWKCFDRFDGRCKFSTWVHGILRHRFLKHLRKTSRMERLISSEACPPDAEDTTALTPGISLLAHEKTNTLRAALHQLPHDQAQVVELRFFAGASLADIAECLGCPTGTVKSRLHHGLKKLRENAEVVNLLESIGEP